jgi:hypothetical protein
MWIPFARIACPGSFPLPAGLSHSRRVLIAVLLMPPGFSWLGLLLWMTRSLQVHVCSLPGRWIARCQLSDCHLCPVLLSLAPSRSAPLVVLSAMSPWDRVCCLQIGFLLASERYFAAKPHSHVICCLGQSTHIKKRDCIMYSVYFSMASDWITSAPTDTIETCDIGAIEPRNHASIGCHHWHRGGDVLMISG